MPFHNSAEPANYLVLTATFLNLPLLGPVKLNTVLPTARYRCDICLKGAVLPGRNDVEMGPANSLHALAYNSEYNKRFNFDYKILH